MNILICNVGSTSLKYQLFAMEDGERVIAAGGAERVGAARSLFYRNADGKKVQEECVFPTLREAIQKMLECLPAGETVDCVGFKVVHAKGVTGVQELNDDVLAAMEAFNSVAPAHNAAGSQPLFQSLGTDGTPCHPSLRFPWRIP